MPKLLLVILSFFLFASASAHANYVRGYYNRSTGSYTNGYNRSNADGNLYNNYSTRGNVNPYTGESGYVDPYANR